MLINFMSWGYSEELFWTLTLRRYFNYRASAMFVQGRARDLNIMNAWYTAILSRQEKIESLDTYLPESAKPVLTEEEKNRQLFAALSNFM